MLQNSLNINSIEFKAISLIQEGTERSKVILGQTSKKNINKHTSFQK